MTRIAAIVTALSMLACAPTTVATTTTSIVPPDLELGRLGERTAFERGERLAAAQAPAPAPATPPPNPASPTPPGTVPDTAGPDPGETQPQPSTQPKSPSDVGSAPAPAPEGEPGGSAPTADRKHDESLEPDAPLDDPGEPDRRQRARTGLFWTGIVLTAIGGAGLIAFSAAGEGIEDSLHRGYRDGDLTRERDDKLRNRGEIMNGLAIGSAALTLVGVAFATIAFGVDWTRCGKLAKRRRKPCRERSG